MIDIRVGDTRDVLTGRFIRGSHAYRVPQPHWQRVWLEHEYITNLCSAGDIAKTIGCTEANVLFWLRKHGITRRTISEARQIKKWGVAGAANPMYGKIGRANPRYIDGSSPERQTHYARGEGKAFLRAVLKRDGYVCRRCAAPKKGSKSLHVHHVSPWAGNPSLRFDLDNAVTLCRTCHSWVHSKKNTMGEYLA